MKNKKNNEIINIKKGEENMNNEIVKIPEGKKEVKVNAIRSYYNGKITRAVETQLRSIVKRFENHTIRANAKMSRIFIIAKDGAIEATLTVREIEALSNMCYQISNGGISQGRLNGYSTSDRPALIRALDKMNMNELKSKIYGAGRSGNSSEGMTYGLYDSEIGEDLKDILEKISSFLENEGKERIVSPNNSRVLDALKGE